MMLIALALVAAALVAAPLFYRRADDTPPTAAGGIRANQCADELEALKADFAAREDQWIADLEQSMPALRVYYADLCEGEQTVASIQEKYRIDMVICDGERCLKFLKSRKAASQQKAVKA